MKESNEGKRFLTVTRVEEGIIGVMIDIDEGIEGDEGVEEGVEGVEEGNDDGWGVGGDVESDSGVREMIEGDDEWREEIKRVIREIKERKWFKNENEIYKPISKIFKWVLVDEGDDELRRGRWRWCQGRGVEKREGECEERVEGREEGKGGER